MFRMCWISWKQWCQNICHSFIRILRFSFFNLRKPKFCSEKSLRGGATLEEFLSKLLKNNNNNKHKKFCSHLLTTTSKAKETTPQIFKNISKNDPTVWISLEPQIYPKVPPEANFRSAGKSASHHEATWGTLAAINVSKRWGAKHSSSASRREISENPQEILFWVVCGTLASVSGKISDEIFS